MTYTKGHGHWQGGDRANKEKGEKGEEKVAGFEKHGEDRRCLRDIEVYTK